MSQISLLNTQIRELISIGASIAGSCLPCLRFHLAEAVKAGCSLEDITEVIALSKKVKERPLQDIYKLADDLLARENTKTSTTTI